MSPRRLKTVLLIAGIAASGFTLLTWTQTWFIVTLVPDELGGGTIPVGGEIAAGGLAALGLAGLALVGALAIAGPVFRVVLGALEALIGITVILSAVSALLDPVRATSRAVTEFTGVSGPDSVAGLVRAVPSTPWPWLAAALGVASVTLGVVIVVTGRRWPVSAGKYQAVRVSGDDLDAPEEAQSAPESDAVADWDALSDGSDPTSR